MFANVMSLVCGSNSVPHATQRRTLFGRGELGVNGRLVLRVGTGAIAPHLGQEELLKSASSFSTRGVKTSG